MKIPSTFRWCALLTGLALAVPTLSLSRAADATTNSTAEAPAVNPGRFTLEIHDGEIIAGGKPVGSATVGNILAYLKKQNHDFSLVLGPGVADVHVGEMILQMDHFDLQAICLSIANCAETPLATQVEDGTDVSVLTAVGQKRDVAVFNLSNYLPAAQTDEKTAQQKVEALTQIITNTFAGVYSFVAPSDQPAFQFHAGANLLVVTGTKDAIDIANKVVNAVIHPDADAGGDESSNPFAAKSSQPGTDDPTGAYLYWANTRNGPAPNRRAQDVAQLQAAISEWAQVQAQLSRDTSPEMQAALKELQKNLDELKKMGQGMPSDPAAAAQWVQTLPSNVNVVPQTPPPAGSGPAFSAPAGTAR